MSDDLTAHEQLARTIAFWHGQKMVRQVDGEMQTVASLAGYGRWAHSAENYAEKRWREYIAAAEAIAALIAEARAAGRREGLEEAPKWQPIETAPKNKYVLTATRHYGGWKIQKAHFIEKYTQEDNGEFSEYCEENDTYYVPEGWYEICHEHDEYAAMAMSETPELWQPMPASPIRALATEPRDDR